MTIDYLEQREEAVFDTECYTDYWSIGFMNIKTGKHVIYELHDGQPLNIDGIRKQFKKFRTFGFNSKNYDMPMIAFAMSGATTQQLKKANDAIIVGGLRDWQFYDRYGVKLPAWIDHIDLMEPAPGVRLGLKKYGARMNSKYLYELPFDPKELIGEERRPAMRHYLKNDLQLTRELRLGLIEEIKQRSEISAEYGIDVRSKSDAQIAEALIKMEVQKTGKEVGKAVVRTTTFRYTPPTFIRFKTEKLQSILSIITSTTFKIDAEDPSDKKTWGVVKMPDEIKKIKLRIGFTDYKMGLGGLHSNEKKRSFMSDDENVIVDRDVRAYYPRVMIACGYVPEALGQSFIGVFTKFVNLRDTYKEKAAYLKKLGDAGQSLIYKKRSDTFKIVNNGTFGKTGSPYSILYAPKLMISTTITGQLSLLMLIEELESNKFSVISANTDGIVTVIPRHRRWLFNSIIFDWECDTSFFTEEVEYAGVYSRDVNSYIALPHDYATNEKAEIKRKGVFAKAGLQAKHDPTFDICSTAVIEYLKHGTAIEETIDACEDLMQFIGVRQATGGGYKDGAYLGKMVRWYYALGERGFIQNAKGARVAGTSGAKPCMDLPDDFPIDIDYEWYVREAYARLDDIGLDVRQGSKRSGYVLASLPKQKTAHIIDMKTRISLCERSEKKVREAWIEHDSEPDDMRICRHCQDERGTYVEEDDDGL